MTSDSKPHVLVLGDSGPLRHLAEVLRLTHDVVALAGPEPAPVLDLAGLELPVVEIERREPLEPGGSNRAERRAQRYRRRAR
jgi:hypothetical protein